LTPFGAAPEPPVPPRTQVPPAAQVQSVPLHEQAPVHVVAGALLPQPAKSAAAPASRQKIPETRVVRKVIG
jgi:hypothetical protein